MSHSKPLPYHNHSKPPLKTARLNEPGTGGTALRRSGPPIVVSGDEGDTVSEDEDGGPDQPDEESNEEEGSNEEEEDDDEEILPPEDDNDSDFCDDGDDDQEDQLSHRMQGLMDSNTRTRISQTESGRVGVKGVEGKKALKTMAALASSVLKTSSNPRLLPTRTLPRTPFNPLRPLDLLPTRLNAGFKAPTFLRDPNAGNRGGMRGGSSLGMRRKTNLIRGPLFDPDEPGALVLFLPDPGTQFTPAQELELLKSKPPVSLLGGAGEGESQAPWGQVAVVVDPVLSRVLRPHQIEGVRFMYECTTGMKSEGCFGCIMADEMGLGKTLQCITLLWTLLCQSPVPGKATIQKAIITCPSSLVKNWANELTKWLGSRIAPLACDNKGTKQETTKDLEQFVAAKGKIYNPVLIISYETLRSYTELLKKTEIGLLMADEGHRLKNAESLTYQALNSLNAKRRIILSGTPIQNDLSEYFALLSFAIPNVLGSPAEFRKNLELPILRGRDADASDKDRARSEEKLTELLGIANKFIIRRTAELLTKYLPVKYEHVVFCKLTPLQLALYQYFCSSKEIRKLLSGVGSQPLKAITMLKKLCNHPALLDQEDFPRDLFPPDFDHRQCQSIHGGKMILLERMITQMKKTTTDKIVLISNYTQTLDLFERMCRQQRWPCIRLDGSLSIQKRQKLVDRFNDPEGREFIFLLSSKAGGCGINLIGANRLVLFDPDWNPANDAQALARVWRDGQVKTCFIYRFIATGTIEEKVFQRQAHKQSLSSCVVDAEEDVERHFSLESLRQLFMYNEETMCDTHDMFKCKRCKNGKQMVGAPEGTINTGATAADTSSWNHYSNLDLFKIHDVMLKEQAQALKDIVTFVFQNKSHDQQVVKLKV